MFWSIMLAMVILSLDVLGIAALGQEFNKGCAPDVLPRRAGLRILIVVLVVSDSGLALLAFSSLIVTR